MTRTGRLQASEKTTFTAETAEAAERNAMNDAECQTA